ncbi:hypothetical protein DB88DRAFT_471251 [Papiliotrema laurentii]|uniref:Uncharacterized protein n=1 Tax=Papiliotrema laurentii TaxID=5418 RepID=A0AAD9L8Q3_PAPLA|nr:hypothetical protein DB88DRAFT_471251 [Papiliotrema laurentii]
MDATSASSSKRRKFPGRGRKSAETGTQQKRVATPLMYRYHETKVGLFETAPAEPFRKSYMTKEELIELSGQIEQKFSDPSIAAVTIYYDKGVPGEDTCQLSWDEDPEIAPSDNFVVETLIGGGASSTKLTYMVKGCFDGKSEADKFIQRLPVITRPKGIYAWRISKTNDDSKDSVGAMVALDEGRMALWTNFLQHLKQLRSTVLPQGTRSGQSVRPTQSERSTRLPRLPKPAEYKCQLIINQPEGFQNGTIPKTEVWQSVFTKDELKENTDLLEKAARTLADGGLPSGSTFAILPSSLHKETPFTDLSCPVMNATAGDKVLVESLKRQATYGQTGRTWKYFVRGGPGPGTKVKDYVNRAPKQQVDLEKSGTTIRISRNDGQSPLHSLLGRAPEGMIHGELARAIRSQGAEFVLPFDHLKTSGTLEDWNAKRSQARDSEQQSTFAMESGTANPVSSVGMAGTNTPDPGNQPPLPDHSLPFLTGTNNFLPPQFMSSPGTTPYGPVQRWPQDFLTPTQMPPRLSSATPGSLSAPFHLPDISPNPHSWTASLAVEAGTPFLGSDFSSHETVPQKSLGLSQLSLSAPRQDSWPWSMYTQPSTGGPEYNHHPEDPRANEVPDIDHADEFANGDACSNQ